MNTQDFFRPSELERNSFLWSEARLIIAAAALFLGGIPPVYYFFGSWGLSGILSPLLKISWVISGLASAYITYQYNEKGRRVFGGTQQQDMIAFWIMVVSGFNLGLAGIIGQNVGMTIASGSLVFFLVGLAYLWACWHLWQRYQSHGNKLF